MRNMTAPNIDREALRGLSHLVLCYEVNRPIPDEAVARTLAPGGVSSPLHILRLRPLDQVADAITAHERQWQIGFVRTSMWIDEIEEALAQAGADPAIHVFAYAPLPLLFYLGM